MAKGSNSTAPKENPNNTLTIDARTNEDAKVLLARNVLRPSVRAGVTSRAFSQVFGELDLNSLIGELAAQVRSTADGDLGREEAMLVAQAHTLEAIFHELARRAALNMGEYINAAETYMRLALKAQSQCRATIETLALMKNPQPVTFVRQANVAHGPQQVNNVPQPVPEQASRARESQNSPNKLLEQQRGKRVDAGAAQAAVGTHSTLEPVGEVHGTENGGREASERT